MEVIRRHHTATLRKPIAIIAFGGWNDACDVASTSAEFVVDAHNDPDVFAEIEPDAIYDFQQHRPSITIDDGVAQTLRWPTIRFTALSRPADAQDLIVVSGPEPNFHWKTVARSIAETLADGMTRLTRHGRQPVLLCDPQLRAPVRKMIAPVMPEAVVLAYSEVDSSEIQSVGSVGI